MTPEIKSHLIENAITSVSLAGSYVQGTQTEYSDIDLIVDVDADRVSTDFFLLAGYLESKFGKKIDLIDRTYINPHIKEALLLSQVFVW